LNSVCSSIFRSWAQSNLTQPLLFSKTLGKTVSRSCGGSSMILGIHNEISWYQQHPGITLKLLVYYTNTGLSGVPDCFSGSKSGKTTSLTISRCQAKGEADYHC
ncbi:hypothetical protein PANDA_022323, partial [Ailuropoda melanoleuca]